MLTSGASASPGALGITGECQPWLVFRFNSIEKSAISNVFGFKSLSDKSFCSPTLPFNLLSIARTLAGGGVLGIGRRDKVKASFSSLYLLHARKNTMSLGRPEIAVPIARNS